MTSTHPPLAWSGAGYLLAGARLLRHPAVRPFVVWPLVVGTGVWLVLGALAVRQAGIWIASAERLLPGWLDWLAWLLWPLLVVVFGVALAYGFAAVVALLAAPFYAALARRVECLADPDAPAPVEYPLAQEVLRCVWAEVRKLAYFALVGIPLAVSLWIPGVNLITGPLWLAWTAWVVALEYLDFAAGNHGLDFRAVRALTRTAPVRTLGFGGLTLAALAIPLVNLIAMPAAVAGAALWWVDLRRARARASGPLTHR